MKKYKAGIIIAALTAACALPHTMAETYLTVKNFSGKCDFEDFNTGIVGENGDVKRDVINSDGTALCDIFALVPKGNCVTAVEQTEDRYGNPTKALRVYVDGISTASDGYHLMQTRYDTAQNTSSAWDINTRGKYYVWKMRFKSGGEGHGVFRNENAPNFENYLTVDFSSGNVYMIGQPEQKAFHAGEWVDFTYVIDRTDRKDDVNHAIFESESCGRTELIKSAGKKMVIKNSEPRWLGMLFGGSDSPEDPQLWIDDIEILSTTYNVTCPDNGVKGVVPSDKIRLKLSGDYDEDSLSGIRVTDAYGDVGISDISSVNDECIITLAEKMKDFTEYKVDYSCVKSKYGFVRSGLFAEFTTTGKITLTSELDIGKLNKNEKEDVSAICAGTDEINFKVRNNTDIPADTVCIIAMMKKNGETEQLCYKYVSVRPDEDASLTARFSVPGRDCVIEAYAKDNLNGTQYYTDKYIIDASGIIKTQPDENEEVTVISDEQQADGEVAFYELTLGSKGSRNKITAVKPGLVECSVKADADGEKEMLFIAALKKDGKLVRTAAVKQCTSEEFHTVLAVPDDGDHVIDVFLWSDIFGTDSYIRKASLE